MQRKNLKKLATAISAATLLLGANSPVLALEVTAAAFVQDLNANVQRGDIDTAREALTKLLAMGITQLRVGGQLYDVAELIRMMDDPALAQSLLLQLVAALTVGGDAAFIAQNQVVATVDLDVTADLFPTGSAG